ERDPGGQGAQPPDRAQRAGRARRPGALNGRGDALDGGAARGAGRGTRGRLSRPRAGRGEHMSDVRVSPLTPAIGAVVEGVDLRRMDAETFERVHTALLDRQVLFFRDQHLTDEEHVAVASAWGEPMVFPVAQLL